jgi:hypothetical protein
MGSADQSERGRGRQAVRGEEGYASEDVPVKRTALGALAGPQGTGWYAAWKYGTRAAAVILQLQASWLCAAMAA